MTARRARRRDEGTTTVEVVVLAPVVLVLLCFVVGLGRISDARGQLTGAVRDAARAASLAATPAAARAAAAGAARADLTDAGIDCQALTVSVDTAAFTPGGEVTVRLGCTAQLADLALSGLPGHLTLHGSATVPLNRYAVIGS